MLRSLIGQSFGLKWLTKVFYCQPTLGASTGCGMEAVHAAAHSGQTELSQQIWRLVRKMTSTSQSDRVGKVPHGGAPTVIKSLDFEAVAAEHTGVSSTSTSNLVS